MKKLFVFVLSALFFASPRGSAYDGAKNNEYKGGQSRQHAVSGQSAAGAAQRNSADEMKKYGGNFEKLRNTESDAISIELPSSGFKNRNFPFDAQNRKKQETGMEPSYGILKWNSGQTPAKPEKKYSAKNDSENGPVPEAHIKNEGFRAYGGKTTARAAHNRPRSEDVTKKRLGELGVNFEPSYITKREEVIHTDRLHSSINYPKQGLNKKAINALPFSYRHFNDSAIKSRMALISGLSWQKKVMDLNKSETMSNNYYWHKDRDFDYCHVIDSSGYHWYGLYAGDRFFWLRFFSNRWWWYDADFDRWCFWNNGFWWWQDPYHFGDIYLYNETDYIPCNTSEDSVLVNVPQTSGEQSYTSQDKRRTVKILSDARDAFLYDNTAPPAFNPVYLASGVKEVMFSGGGNGVPLEIILKLENNTFNMFDDRGRPFISPGREEDGR